MNDNPVPQRNRNRFALIAIFAIFFGAFALAGILRFSGWRPIGMKNHGELLQPPGDLRAITPHLADGSVYAWDPIRRTWRILVAPPENCGQACATLASEIGIVRQLFGRDAGHVDVLWLGALPASTARDQTFVALRDDPTLGRSPLPRPVDPAGVPVFVVDPNGFVVLRYAPGFDPSHLRQDLSRLLKLK
jgi:hypothetical protein